MRTTAVIGLGLMGGSLARDLAAAGERVLAHDADPAGPIRAKDEGIVAGVLDDTLAGVGDADLIVIATPVDRSGAILDRVATHLRADAVVTDVGSVKAGIIARAAGLGLADRFVGSHPLAGDHRSGWTAARTGLYRGATVFVCPTPQTAPAALERVQALWEGVGASCARLDAAEHDTRVAWVSHLPQLAASAVAAAIARAGYPPSALGTGGRDVTRLAGSSPEMWSAICRENAGPVSAALDGLSAELSAVAAAVRAGDDDALRRFFLAGRAWLS